MSTIILIFVVFFIYILFRSYSELDLNQQPSAYKADALTS